MKHNNHCSSDDNSVVDTESECNSRENNDHATTAGNSMSGKEIEDHSSSATEGDLDIFTPKHDVERRSRRIITTPQGKNDTFDKKNHGKPVCCHSTHTATKYKVHK